MCGLVSMRLRGLLWPLKAPGTWFGPKRRDFTTAVVLRAGEAGTAKETELAPLWLAV